MHFLPFLDVAALRVFGACSSHFLCALKSIPAEHLRACEFRKFVRWGGCGGGACISGKDVAVAVGGGGWNPGGVAVADLFLKTHLNISFRFTLETDNQHGNLLVGLTRCQEELDAQFQEALAIGYKFVIDRELAHDYASIFYSGGCLRCPFFRRHEKRPEIDDGPAGATEVQGPLSGLRNAGDWIAFHVSDGKVRAQDFRGQVFEWGASLQVGEVWRPCVAWRGSTARVRIHELSSQGLLREKIEDQMDLKHGSLKMKFLPS